MLYSMKYINAAICLVSSVHLLLYLNWIIMSPYVGWSGTAWATFMTTLMINIWNFLFLDYPHVQIDSPELL